MTTQYANLVQAIIQTLARRPGLLARELKTQLSQIGITASRSTINTALYGDLRRFVVKNANHRWHLAETTSQMVKSSPRKRSPSSSTKTRPAKSMRRLWTEDEMVLVYWILPLMREISIATGREYPAIAMKIANLLAVETGGKEGLTNTSSLDRAIVEQYKSTPETLEQRALTLLQERNVVHDRSDEIQDPAIDLLSSLKIPLHIDIIAAALAARKPMIAAPRTALRKALQQSTNVDEGPKDVFVISSNPR
jgi:hypothetical protein